MTRRAEASRTAGADRKARGQNTDQAYRTHPVFARDREQEQLRRERRPLERRLVLLQLGFFGLVFVLWPLPIVNPIKLLVVLFHELSHVVAAYATGGVVFGIAIDPGGAGVTLGFGGDEVLVVAAGYAGSLLIGILLYSLSAVWEPGDVWGVLCGLAALSLVFGWLNDFTAVFGYGALLLIAIGVFVLADEVKTFALRLVATTSCLYPLIDVAGEWFSTSEGGFRVRGETVGSDVAVLARMTALPEAGIVAAWAVVGVVVVLYLILWSARKEATVEAKKTLFWRRQKQLWKIPWYRPEDPDSIQEHTVR